MRTDDTAEASRSTVSTPSTVESKQDMDATTLAEQVTVIARVAKSSFIPMEPIAVGFEVHNSTQFSLEFGGLGLPDPSFWVEVFDEEMREISKTRYHSAYFERSKTAGQMNSPPSLKPGTSRRSMLIANWPYDMTARGRYTIVINVPFLVNSATEKGKPFYVKSDPVEVEVNWVDPTLLLKPDDNPHEPMPFPLNRHELPKMNPPGHQFPKIDPPGPLL